MTVGAMLRRRLDDLEREAARCREAEESLRLLMNAVTDYAIIMLDPSGRITSWSSGAERCFGYRADEMLGQSVGKLCAAASPTSAPCGTARHGEHTIDEYWMMRKDGTRFWASGVTTAVAGPSGQLRGYAKVIRDLTERRQWEDELLLRERALDALNTGVLITGSLEEDTPILYANQAFLRIFGCTESQIRGRNPRFMQGPGTDRAAVAAIGEALREGRECRVTLLNYRLDGTSFWNNLFVSPVRDPHGRVTHFVGLEVDVTEERRVEERIRQVNESLERRVAERTASLRDTNRELDAFASTIAHDLRAPLRAIVGFARIIENECGTILEPRAQDYLRRIADAGQRMDVLIRDLLAYSRLARTEMEAGPVDLDAVVANVREELAPEIERSHANVRIVGPLGRVVGNEVGLGLITRNLLSNALKFVPAGTTPVVLVRSEREDRRVRLWVEDNGLGIPPEYHGKIFEIFQQLHGPSAYPGTGVGLALALKAVQRLGGEIGVESGVGSGSRFWVRLPAA